MGDHYFELATSENEISLNCHYLFTFFCRIWFQQYQVAYVIVKSAIAPRPGNWILERSLDNIEWKPWQYFAITDDECERIYGIKAVDGVPRFEKDDSVVCTSLYSRLDPLENGEVPKISQSIDISRI